MLKPDFSPASASAGDSIRRRATSATAGRGDSRGDHREQAAGVALYNVENCGRLAGSHARAGRGRRHAGAGAGGDRREQGGARLLTI